MEQESTDWTLSIGGDWDDWRETTEEGIAPIIRRLHNILLDVHRTEGLMPNIDYREAECESTATSFWGDKPITINGKGREIQIINPDGISVIYRAETVFDSRISITPEDALFRLQETVSIKIEDLPEEEIFHGTNIRIRAADGKAMKSEPGQHIFSMNEKIVPRKEILHTLFNKYEDNWSATEARKICRNKQELERALKETPETPRSQSGYELLKPREEHIPGQIVEAVPLSRVKEFTHSVLDKTFSKEDMIDEISLLVRRRGALMSRLANAREATRYKSGPETVTGFEAIYGLDSDYIWVIPPDVFLDIINPIRDALEEEYVNSWSVSETSELTEKVRKSVENNSHGIYVSKHDNNLATIIMSVLPHYKTNGTAGEYKECLLCAVDEERQTFLQCLEEMGDENQDCAGIVHRLFTFGWWQTPPGMEARAGDHRIQYVFKNKRYAVALRLIGDMTEQRFSEEVKPIVDRRYQRTNSQTSNNALDE